MCPLVREPFFPFFNGSLAFVRRTRRLKVESRRCCVAKAHFREEAGLQFSARKQIYQFADRLFGKVLSQSRVFAFLHGCRTVTRSLPVYFCLRIVRAGAPSPVPPRYLRGRQINSYSPAEISRRSSPSTIMTSFSSSVMWVAKSVEPNCSTER